MIGELGTGSIVADSTMAVHVLAGIAALVAGLGAIATRKGGGRHNLFGRAYALAMAIVVVTAVPLAIRAGNWFLLAIAVFSGYLVFAGYRVVQRRRAGLTAPTALDLAGHGTMVAVGGGMIGAGVWQSVTGPVGLAPALATFGGIGAGFAAFALAQFRSSPAKRPPWIQKHVAFVGGAYIATVTAVITVNLSMVPPLIRWLGPTIVGTPLIVYAIRTYTPRFEPAG
ncbi:hypothetical protein [Natrarchaeobius oligotrophus]|uniref:DUF2306 domain-containing protein n=1 Tax=Natrarchaeobius chitinivorans TaxID=1679083 RepID=A0A3N6M0J2_NATCH|nr:hypothetical protein [Natrarchaeobius chitinivorans]RQG96773.1 hypothetical protein EA472_20200 [Natrarchaeobius chitinivorans]